MTSPEDEDLQENHEDNDESKEEVEKGKAKDKPTEEDVNLRVTLPYKPKGEMFGVAETFQGGSRLQVICEDGIRRMGRIPGTVSYTHLTLPTKA